MNNHERVKYPNENFMTEIEKVLYGDGTDKNHFSKTFAEMGDHMDIPSLNMRIEVWGPVHEGISYGAMWGTDIGEGIPRTFEEAWCATCVAFNLEELKRWLHGLHIGVYGRMARNPNWPVAHRAAVEAATYD